MKFYLLLTIWIFLIFLTGCSRKEIDSYSETSQTHIIEIKQMKFVPSQVVVSPGDSIRWINRDIVAHNVAEETSTDWKSPDLNTGESFTIKIHKEQSYLCTLHPVMKGKIELKGD